jgi:serine phosphatase RsbU (regulator of sigma subunit)
MGFLQAHPELHHLLRSGAPDATCRHEAEHHVASALEAMPAAFFSLDRQWRFSYLNAHARQLLAPVHPGLVGRNVWEEFPSTVGSRFDTGYRQAVAHGKPVTFEAYHPPPLDAWFEVLAWPGPDGLTVSFRDVTARRRQQDRTQLLGAVTDQLTCTMQVEQAVAYLAERVVPALADWCVVTLVDETGRGGARRRARDMAGWHGDERMRPLVERYASLRIPALRDESFLLRALAAGRRIVHERGATRHLQRLVHPGAAHDLLDRLAPEAFVVLPLRGRDRPVGLLTLFNGTDRGSISSVDLATASEVAARAGLALDNARLYRQQRVVAETLQRSLLLAPPEHGHAEVVVRYLPAAESAAVGGDWSDTFVQADGATMLVIGDVVGHDIAAAATMGQLRGLLRGIATSDDIGPAEMLSRLDASMALLEPGALSTAVVARLEQDRDGELRNVTRLRWSNAGHPPPLLVDVEGTVSDLTARRPEMILGVDHATARTESVVTLDHGATVLLYTDGLVERRDTDLDAGVARLKRALADLADLPLPALCDQLIDRLVHGRPDDDVALVAVRLPGAQPGPGVPRPEPLPVNQP